MNCSCHGEAMYWRKDRRTVGGGYWVCAVKSRARSRANYHGKHGVRKLQRQRDRYDCDPVYRIGKGLHDGARERRATLIRRREALGSL